MLFPYLNKIIYKSSATIEDILLGFNHTAILTENKGFAIIVDHNKKCLGVVTEGDIRRKLLKNLFKIKY